MTLCRYKDIFGKPNEGAHRFRIGPFAAVDLLGTIAIAFLLCYLLSYSSSDSANWQQFALILTALFLLGESLHVLFCVSTPVTRQLGLDSDTGQ